MHTRFLVIAAVLLVALSSLASVPAYADDIPDNELPDDDEEFLRHSAPVAT